MAAASPSRNLEDEATCSICLEYFKDPVIIGCGHIFCQSCISRCWQGSDTNFACPQCREISQERKFQPIRQLGNLVEMLKLHLPSLKSQENVCEKHQQRLQLFCEDDQEPICVVCDRSRDHRSHTVVPVEEAAQEYKKMMEGRLFDLRSSLEDVERFATDEETKRAELEGEFQSQAEKVTRTFEDLQQFLEQEKKTLLAKLEKEQTEHLQKISVKITDLEKQKACFKDLIEDIEGKCHQDDVELLKDVRNILNRSDSLKVLLLKNDSVDSTVQNLQSFISQHAYIQEKIREFKDGVFLYPGGRFPRKNTNKVAAEAWTLDPDIVLPEPGSQKLARSTDAATMYLDVVNLSQPIGLPVLQREEEHCMQPFFSNLTFEDIGQDREGFVMEISPESNVDIFQTPVESIKMASAGIFEVPKHPPKKPVIRTDAVQPMLKEHLNVTQRMFNNPLTRSTRQNKSENLPYAYTSSDPTDVKFQTKSSKKFQKGHGFLKQF
ncbi:E3 ubiquitin-protein ligase TRIM39-like [Pleurodeles waltl]|uniref:E3 ubiquitin-protein ligase TRIM39-like n=1 Tax=Pleurodeles waltl TaxID=8319 RepID=UPI003709AD10